MARTLPYSTPVTRASPTRSVPSCTSTVATGPRPFSSLASMTTPEASFSGLDLRSSTSACSAMYSSSSGSPCLVRADTGIMMVVPPHCSGTSSYSVSCCMTRSGVAPGLSILLMATRMVTPAALACLMASMVCGMTPSSAATTSTTRSVTWAPRCRMAVKASWPGVSRKVMGPWAVCTE